MSGRRIIVLTALLAVSCGAPAPAPTPAPVRTATPPTTAPGPTSVQATPSPDLTPTATPSATEDARTVGWRSDIASLVPGMDALHPDLDHGTSMHDLNDAAERLSQSVPQATDDELLAGVLRIVASVSAAGCDGHLGAFVWGTGSYPVDSLPLRLWLFDDGVYIVDALPPYEDLVGSRILSMAGHPMDDVLTTVDPIIPRDNYQTVRLLMPRFLLLPQVHHGLGLVSDPAAPMEMELEARDSTTRASVEPISMADYNAWAGSYGLHLPADPDVLYLSRIGDDLWWQPLDDGTLFVQYNRVERRFLADLEEAVTNPSVTRIVLDIRHNFGGEVPIVEEMVRIFTNPVVDQPGKLFLITGRNTLSAGSLLTARLDQDSSAVIVGETMGGCPTFWGDIEPVSLPYSGIEVSVPTMLEVGVDPDDDRLVIDPELPAPLTVEDWAAGVDPALEAIDAFDQ